MVVCILLIDKSGDNLLPRILAKKKTLQESSKFLEKIIVSGNSFCQVVISKNLIDLIFNVCRKLVYHRCRGHAPIFINREDVRASILTFDGGIIDASSKMVEAIS